jgi:2-desacetyl-2-hydroxyethyl bacteriochlorophyllide A dehydrogenase
MRAVILRSPFKLEMANIPRPTPKNDEVLIRVKAVGICGSDVRYFHGENPWALHTIGKDLKETKSFILGHEVSGEIVETGEWVSKNRVSEKVGVLAFKGCEECYYCKRGFQNLCEHTLHIGHDGRWGDIEYPPGGYAEYMPIWASNAYRLPDHVSYEEATQLDGLAVAVHANNRANISPADKVVAIGCGAIGLMVLQVAKTRGASKTIALDTWDKPLEKAESLGVDYTINVKKNRNFVEEVLRLTGGVGVNVVFDTVGSSDTIKTGLSMLARMGRLIMLAVTPAKIELNLTDIVGGEKTLTCSANHLYEDYIIGVELLASGQVKVKPFITHIMRLEEYKEAFDMLLHKEEYGAIKIVLKP